MDFELQNGVCKRPSSRTSLGDISALLAHDNTEQAKRLKDEATSILHERYTKLAGMDVVDILKVVGNVNTWVCGAQQEITELCISIAFPLLILRCRLLANLLASLSTLDDHGRVPDMPWDSQKQSTLGRLDGGFYSYYLWRREWFDVFERWKRQAEDSIWLGAKVSGMRNLLDETRPIFICIEDSFDQITTITGISFRDLTRNIQNTLEMLETRLAECEAKAEELRVKGLLTNSPSSLNVARVPSWTSGTETAIGEVAQRPVGKRAPGPDTQPETSTGSMFQRVRAKAHERASIYRNQDWTKLFELAKSPVLLILMVAMPFTVYSTILCETPDALPAIDSNFWSTLSQCVSGFAGLYVVTSPMFSGEEKDKIKTGFPKTFYTMLVLSLATSIVSAVAYAWSPRASIPLGYLSGLTLNIATLLIIQDSGNQIKETNELNERLEKKLTKYQARR